MARNELSPMEQANQEIPQSWYELSNAGNTLLTYCSAASLNLLNYSVFHLDSPLIHILGATVFTLSVLADRYSTVLALRVIIQAEKMGVETGLVETNYLVPDILTPREFLLNKRAAAWDIGRLAFSSFLPFAGIGFALGAIEGTTSNLKEVARVNRAIGLASI